MIPFGRKFMRGVGQSEWWSPHTLDTVSSHIWDSRMFLLVVFFTLHLGGRNSRKLSLLLVLELKQNILEFHALQILNNWHYYYCYWQKKKNERWRTYYCIRFNIAFEVNSVGFLVLVVSEVNSTYQYVKKNHFQCVSYSPVHSICKKTK